MLPSILAIFCLADIVFSSNSVENRVKLAKIVAKRKYRERKEILK